MRLPNKTAIVTGAARGIGKAIAQGFAHEGASVIVADILGEQAEQTAVEIRAAGGNARAVTVDLADLNTHESLVNTACERFGRLDILVNNAAIEPRALFLDATPEDWERTFNINLRAVFSFAMRRRATTCFAASMALIISRASGSTASCSDGTKACLAG
jgi:glucose 1-dehydrogenase